LRLVEAARLDRELLNWSQWQMAIDDAAPNVGQARFLGSFWKG
jgi:hypothetical protein